MNKYIGQPGTGKTKRLLLAASENKPAIIVCKDPNKMRTRAAKYNIDTSKMLFIHYFDYSLEDEVNQNIYIDNLEDYIYSRTSKVKGYSDSIKKGHILE